MWVIKLGGSLLGSVELVRWLNLVAQHGDGKVIVVPGGGIFADAVRQSQQMLEMSEACAHHLAVLAMNQFGRLLIDLSPDLATASSELEIAERSWQHRGIVWMPSQMVLADTEIAHSWDVTSDSLAAWLAHKIHAEKLILVKSRKPDVNVNLHGMVQQALVDRALPMYLKESPFECWIVDKTDHTSFSTGFSANALSKIGHLVSPSVGLPS